MTVEWIITSSVLILAIMMLRYVFRGKISLRLQYALWALVLIRLLIPVNIGNSQVSVMNVFPTSFLSIRPFERPTENIIAMPPASPTAEGFAEDIPNMGTANTYDSNANTNENANEYANKNTNKYTRLTDWRLILNYIWLVGAAAVGLCLLVSNISFSAKLKRTRRNTNIGNYPLPVYTTGEIATPCIFGLFRPVIYLTPEAVLDMATLRYVLEHEATHWQHKDNIWSFFRCAALALHWYNPLVWWAAMLSRRDAELACDEGTIRRIGEENRLEYGRTLIEFTCVGRKHSPMDLLYCATTMTESNRGIRERITLIARKPKMLLTTLAAVLLASAVAVGCTFTGAGINKSAKGTDYEATEAQSGQHVAEETETRMQPGDIPEKLDELVSNQNLSGDEIRAARACLG